MNWSEYSIKKVKFGDNKYPVNLSRINKPPREIFYRGKLEEQILKNSIAIVGARRMTNYARSATDLFVSGFVFSGVATISGFMYGVDSEVHKKTVDYGGKTVAVFGNGLDIVYPEENKDLYTKILETGGLVVSEYSRNVKPHLWTYPARNRIVAGLASLGVLVIEAGEDSGSLITAKIAKEIGKKVYAIPGPITSSNSVGTNLLIKKGLASLVTDPSDIIEKVFKLKMKSKPDKPKYDKAETEIISFLKREPLTIDELSRELKKDVIEVSRILSLMSLRGLINEVGGKYYR
ncbi:MAG: DNA-processing protein DprA [Patescibacteria group bacterium]